MSIEAFEKIVREMREGNFGCAKCGDSCDCPRTDEIVAKFADRIWAAHKRRIKSIVEVNEMNIETAMNDVTKLREENARLRDALKYAIPWACLKCTLWNSRAARCSLGSGMCDQVWKWKRLLGEVSK